MRLNENILVNLYNLCLYKLGLFLQLKTNHHAIVCSSQLG